MVYKFQHYVIFKHGIYVQQLLGNLRGAKHMLRCCTSCSLPKIARIQTAVFQWERKVLHLPSRLESSYSSLQGFLPFYLPMYVMHSFISHIYCFWPRRLLPYKTWRGGFGTWVKSLYGPCQEHLSSWTRMASKMWFSSGQLAAPIWNGLKKWKWKGFFRTFDPNVLAEKVLSRLTWSANFPDNDFGRMDILHKIRGYWWPFCRFATSMHHVPQEQKFYEWLSEIVTLKSSQEVSVRGKTNQPSFRLPILEIDMWVVSNRHFSALHRKQFSVSQTHLIFG